MVKSTGYISSLNVQPRPLPLPHRLVSRRAELRALLAWILSSWLRPADAEVAWEQRAGHEARLP